MIHLFKAIVQPAPGRTATSARSRSEARLVVGLSRPLRPAKGPFVTRVFGPFLTGLVHLPGAVKADRLIGGRPVVKRTG